MLFVSFASNAICLKNSNSDIIVLKSFSKTQKINKDSDLPYSCCESCSHNCGNLFNLVSAGFGFGLIKSFKSNIATKNDDTFSTNYFIPLAKPPMA